MDETDPRRMGRYQLLSRIGEGGMGEVYRARAHGAEGVVKELCVKLIKRERLARPGASARFVAEARLSMRLNHGNIVPVFDFGRCGEDYYLAMERVDGADLRSILRRLRERGEALPPEVAAHVTAEIARALSYAHGLAEPVVHCDLKPENVLVSASGDVKLADFGLATVVCEHEALGGAGTPRYMAPEQREGDAIGPATDLYGLGLLLTEAATGSRDPRGFEPGEMGAIARELTRRDPGDRPRSAAAVANRLEALVARARADGSESPRERLGELARRAAPAPGEAAARELETTASYARDRDDAFLRSMSMLSTVPPSMSEPAPAPPARQPRWTPVTVAAAALAVGGLFALYALARPSIAPVQPQTVGGQRPPIGTAATTDARGAERTETDPSPRQPSVVESGQPEAPSVTGGARREQAAADDAERTSIGEHNRRARVGAAGRRARHASGASARGEQADPAHLSINAVPWGEVEIDGRPAGVTPLFDVALPPGPHTLRVANPPLGASTSRTIELVSGESRRVVVSLADGGT